MNKLGIIFIFIFSMVCCGANCGKDKDIWEEVFFEFVIPISVMPDVDTISIGQELTIDCDFSDSLLDYSSKKKYYVPDFKWDNFVMLQKISDKTKTFGNQIPALNKFEFQNIIGGFTNISYQFADFTIVYEAGRYYFHAKIKPKERGTYHLRLMYSRIGYFTPLPQSFAPNVPGYKRFPVVKNIRHIFNNENTHYEIYLQNAMQLIESDGSFALDRDAGYTFVVK